MGEIAINIVKVRSISSLSSSKVTPINFDEEELQIDHQYEQNVIDILSNSEDKIIPVLPDHDDGFSGEADPHDRMLPITESRKGNTWTATFHLLCSGIGLQALLLPIGFIALGWVWGTICLTVVFLWQLYTTWLLVNLHESASPNGLIRYSRFLHLSVVAFGPKLGKFLSILPVLYLSSGACIFFTNSGGTTMEIFYQVMCDNNLECRENTLSGAQWFLVFICMAILIALFFPNLNSLAPVTIVGSITAVTFCTLLWILSIKNGRQVETVQTSNSVEFRDVMVSIAVFAIAFRGHNLVLEIQGTLPTNQEVPSRKPMWKGVIISYVLIAMCFYPLAIVGHWTYGNEMTITGGLLRPFVRSHQNNTSKYLVGLIPILMLITYLCGFQIYAMVTFDNFERIFYVSKKNKPSPRWVRSLIKVVFGGILYFVAVALPFMMNLAIFIGSMTLPLTLSYPCFMWLAIKKPVRFSKMWWLNMGIGSSGVVLSLVMFIAALWNLVVVHFHANFFNPR